MAPSSGLGTDRMVSVLDTSLGLSSIQYLAIYTGGETVRLTGPHDLEASKLLFT